MSTDAHDQAAPRLMTVREVADRLGCSRANVYGLINRGLLPVIRIGKSKGYRVDSNDLGAFLRQRKVQYEADEPIAQRPRLKHIKL
jgi:excisionase family DNA binding protein